VGQECKSDAAHRWLLSYSGNCEIEFLSTSKLINSFATVTKF